MARRATDRRRLIDQRYRAALAEIDGVADRIFDTGICLPSGGGLTAAQQDRVIDVLMAELGG